MRSRQAWHGVPDPREKATHELPRRGWLLCLDRKEVPQAPMIEHHEIDSERMKYGGVWYQKKAVRKAGFFYKMERE
jgi:hypothetical protein